MPRLRAARHERTSDLHELVYRCCRRAANLGFALRQPTDFQSPNPRSGAARAAAAVVGPKVLRKARPHLLAFRRGRNAECDVAERGPQVLSRCAHATRGRAGWCPLPDAGVDDAADPLGLRLVDRTMHQPSLSNADAAELADGRASRASPAIGGSAQARSIAAIRWFKHHEKAKHFFSFAW